MDISIKWNDGLDCKQISVANSCESTFYKAVAKVLTKLAPPNRVIVYSDSGEAAYDLIRKSGTMFIKEDYNHIPLKKSNYKSKYLTCVNPEHNNYKFYKIEQQDSKILVTYGRIGAGKNDIYGERQYTYPSNMFWIKYFEKIAKGYIDQSDIFLSPESFSNQSDTSDSSDSYSDNNNSAARMLYRLLKGHAKIVIEKTCVSSVITRAMYDEANANLQELYKAENVNGFNDILLKILTVCPRKVNSVAMLMAHSTLDFPRIIQREEDLVNAMAAMISEPDRNIKPKTNNNIHKSEFDDMGVEVYFATDTQKEQVLNLLSDTLKPKVKNIYRVINKAHKKRFDKYLKDNKIKKIKQLWHGSRNENWLNIINTGLLLKPNAIITGKMFGDGIYFAPSSMKSWGYTSMRGTRWANGNEDICFMGLYATAYGEPLDVTCAHRYTNADLKMAGKNCVHAHAGTQLLNDEIIYYDEAAMVLNYVVEFRM